MWGILIGIGVGTLEVFLLKKLIAMMTSDRRTSALAVFAMIAKLALMLAVLWAMARFVSVEAMLWCAGGLSAALIGIPVTYSILTIRKCRQNGGERQS